MVAMYVFSRSSGRFLNLCESASFLFVKNALQRKFSNSPNLQLYKKRLNAGLKGYCTTQGKNDGAGGTGELDFQAITKGDPEVEHKLKVLQLEIEVLRQEGCLVPDADFMKTEHWEELLRLPSRTARKTFLVFLFKKSKTKENKKVLSCPKRNSNIG